MKKETSPTVGTRGFKRVEETVLARLPRPRSETHTRIGVVSDPHVATESHGTPKMFHTTEELLKTAVSRLNEAEPQPDFVLFNGDLTKDGEPWNFGRFDEIVDGLVPPYAATPGNHDVPKQWDEHDTPSFKGFVSRYASDSYPFLRGVGGVDLIVLNTATVPDNSLSDVHKGAVSREQMLWMKDNLGDFDNPVVAFHHTVRPVTSEDQRGEREKRLYNLRNPDEVIRVLKRNGVPLVVSGHHHVPAAVRYGDVTQLVAPAVCAYPQSHLLLDVDKQGTTIRLVPDADESRQREAYEALALGSEPHGNLLRTAEKTLSEAPVTDELNQPGIGERWSVSD